MSDAEQWQMRADIRKLEQMLPVAITLPRYLWVRLSLELNNLVTYGKPSPDAKEQCAAAAAVIDGMLVVTRLEEPN